MLKVTHPEQAEREVRSQVLLSQTSPRELLRKRACSEEHGGFDVRSLLARGFILGHAHIDHNSPRCGSKLPEAQAVTQNPLLSRVPDWDCHIKAGNTQAADLVVRELGGRALHGSLK